MLSIVLRCHKLARSIRPPWLVISGCATTMLRIMRQGAEKIIAA
jgi:hypothetical protein